MDRMFLVISVASVVLLLGGIAAGALLGGTGAFDQRPRVEPAVTSFSADGATCVADADTTARVSVGNNTRGSFLTVRANVTVTGAEGRVGDATLAEDGLANYTLTYETSAAGARCPDDEQAVVFTQATVGVPHPGGEPFGITARTDDRRLFHLRNTPNGLRVLDIDG
jgi:hypothetical protein